MVGQDQSLITDDYSASVPVIGDQRHCRGNASFNQVRAHVNVQFVQFQYRNEIRFIGSFTSVDSTYDGIYKFFVGREVRGGRNESIIQVRAFSFDTFSESESGNIQHNFSLALIKQRPLQLNKSIRHSDSG